MGFCQNSIIFDSVCFNIDRVIIQHTSKCVENSSGDFKYHIFVYLIIISFFCNIDYYSDSSGDFLTAKFSSLSLLGRACA